MWVISLVIVIWVIKGLIDAIRRKTVMKLLKDFAKLVGVAIIIVILFFAFLAGGSQVWGEQFGCLLLIMGPIALLLGWLIIKAIVALAEGPSSTGKED